MSKLNAAERNALPDEDGTPAEKRKARLRQEQLLERDAEILKMVDAGMQLKRIGQVFGISARAVQRTLRRNGRKAAMGPLNKREKQYVLGRAEGLSMRGAALRAGFSESIANNAGKELEGRAPVRRALADAVRESVPVEKLAQRIAEGIDAERVEHFAHQGVVVSERVLPDLGMRERYIVLAAKVSGALKESLELGGSFQVVLDL